MYPACNHWFPGPLTPSVRNIPNEPSKCNQWKHVHRMLSEHLKCSLPLPTGHIVGKMHMSSKCTQHVITGFQAPSPPVALGWSKEHAAYSEFIYVPKGN